MVLNGTANRNSSSMELLVMYDPMMVGASIVGTKPLDLPITGVDFTTSLKYKVKTLLGPHRGKTVSDRLTTLTRRLNFMNSLNLTWKMTHLSRPTLALCRFQVRSTNWQPCFTTFSSDRESNAAILEKLEIPPADPNANPIQAFTASDLAHLASHLAITSQTLAQHAQNLDLDNISEISN